LPKILSLKKWFPVTYEQEGEDFAIGMELKRLRYDEANRLLVVTSAAFGALAVAHSEKPLAEGEARPEKSFAEKIGELQANAKSAELFYQALKPETLEWIWSDCVRNVTGVEDEDGPVTTGTRLAAFADQRLVMWLLGKLQREAGLSATEGKASSSPSTSGSEGTKPSAESGACPAPSTGSASGEGSTATPTPH
jgi:hypothetical protein